MTDEIAVLITYADGEKREITGDVVALRRFGMPRPIFECKPVAIEVTGDVSCDHGLLLCRFYHLHIHFTKRQNFTVNGRVYPEGMHP